MKSLFDKLGLTDSNDGVFDGEWRGGGAKIDKISPIDGRRIASVRTASAEDYDKAVGRAHDAFFSSRSRPFMSLVHVNYLQKECWMSPPAKVRQM